MGFTKKFTKGGSMKIITKWYPTIPCGVKEYDNLWDQGYRVSMIKFLWMKFLIWAK